MCRIATVNSYYHCGAPHPSSRTEHIPCIVYIQGQQYHTGVGAAAPPRYNPNLNFTPALLSQPHNDQATRSTYNAAAAAAAWGRPQPSQSHAVPAQPTNPRHDPPTRLPCPPEAVVLERWTEHQIHLCAVCTATRQRAVAIGLEKYLHHAGVHFVDCDAGISGGEPLPSMGEESGGQGRA